ncbi:MAG: sensor histidine kinase [Myxococcota bacterium]|nr:sensor histidine kinase [Myxococcota bacterium]
MKAAPDNDAGIERAGKLVFALIVLISLGMSLETTFLGRTSKVTIVALGLTFLVVAVWQLNSWRLHTGAYFVFQNVLAGILVWIGFGATALIPLPILSQGLLMMRRRWALLFAALQPANWLAAIAWKFGWGHVTTPLFRFLAGEIFVLAFTQVVVGERRARRELKSANQRLATLATQAEELATVKERNRLARELHDSVGHYLTIIHVQLQAAEGQIESSPDRARQLIAKAARLTHEGLEDVRRSVAALRASPTDQRTLQSAIGALVEELRASGTPAQLTMVGTPRQLSPPVELTLYRTAQEALTNVRKHSNATRADLKLEYGAAKVCLSVADNGPSTSKPQSIGFGLVGVQERARLVGGDLEIRHGDGFTLKLTIPG